MADVADLDPVANLRPRWVSAHARALAECERAMVAHADLTETSARTRLLVAESRQTRGLLRRTTPARAAAVVGPAVHLTNRQREILVALAAGEGTAELSARLWVTRTTVRNHIAAILRALDAHSRLEAVAIARRRGLL
jgi:DNA-binding NarL/FixJ family response regulator